MTATMYNGILDEVLPARFKDGADYYKLVVIKDPIPNPNVIEVEPPAHEYVIGTAYDKSTFANVKVSSDLLSTPLLPKTKNISNLSLVLYYIYISTHYTY